MYVTIDCLQILCDILIYEKQTKFKKEPKKCAEGFMNTKWKNLQLS